MANINISNLTISQREELSESGIKQKIIFSAYGQKKDYSQTLTVLGRDDNTSIGNITSIIHGKPFSYDPRYHDNNVLNLDNETGNGITHSNPQFPSVIITDEGTDINHGGVSEPVTITDNQFLTIINHGGGSEPVIITDNQVLTITDGFTDINHGSGSKPIKFENLVSYGGSSNLVSDNSIRNDQLNPGLTTETDGTLDNQLNPEFTIENNSSIIGSVIGDDNEDDDDEDLNFDSLTNLNLNNIPVRFNFNADGRADITNFNSSPGDLIQLSENFNDYDLFPTPVTPLPNGLAGTGITNEIISFVENVTSMSLSNLNQSSFV